MLCRVEAYFYGLFIRVFKIPEIKVGQEAPAPLKGAAAQLPCYLAQNRTETFLDFEHPTL